MKPSKRLERVATLLRRQQFHMTAMEVDDIMREVRQLERFHEEACAEADHHDIPPHMKLAPL